MPAIDKLRKLIAENPSRAFREYATESGISYQRVAQLIHNNHLPWVRKSMHIPCWWCDKDLRYQRNKLGLCRNCRSVYLSVWSKCAVCDEWFSRQRNKARYAFERYENDYCSHACWGKVLGIKYGTGSDYQKALAMHD